MRRVRLLNVARRFCSTTKVEESFEDKIYKNQLRKYPNVATKANRITKNYLAMKEIVKSPIIETNCTGLEGYIFWAFGRTKNNNNSFTFQFKTQDGEDMDVKYGSSIIGSGAKMELGMRISFYFSTGLSQILPEVPRTLEISEGEEWSLLQVSIAKFKLQELPTQTFYIITPHVGLALGKQDLSGILYLDSSKSEYEKLNNSFLQKYQDWIKIGFFGILVYSSFTMYQLSTKQSEMNHLPIRRNQSMNTNTLPEDLYEIGDVKEE